MNGNVSGWVRADQVVPFEEAINYCTGPIRDNPGDAGAYINRALIWRDKGEHDIAIRDLNEAIRLNPTFALAYHDRGLAWHAKGEYERAIADSTEAIRLDSGYASAYLNADFRGR